MKNIIITPDAWLRRVLPLVQKTRRWCWKYFDRTARRLVISGGAITFMDAVLQFPRGVALAYATPLFWDGPESYGGPTSRLLSLLISRSRLFLDVGSNVGIYAVYAGVKYPGVTTFAFEPVPIIWKKNSAFHRANRLAEENVLNLALGDREGVQEFLIPVYTTGLEEEQTGTLNTNSWQAREATVERIEVQCTTLDKFAAHQALPEGRCSLKIDVENYEAPVLRGGRQFIRARRPWILCEILPSQKTDSSGNRVNDNDDVLALVRELDYVPFAITEDGLFRMAAVDFAPVRSIKDFLLAPTEHVPADTNYFPMKSLESLLSTP